MATDDLRKSAITMYAAHFYRTKPELSRAEMIAIANEISSISEILPIFWPPTAYKKNEIKDAIDRIKADHKIMRIKATDNNHFIVKGIPGKLSPNQLIALWEYILDTVTNGDLSTHTGFEHLKTAKILAK